MRDALAGEQSTEVAEQHHDERRLVEVSTQRRRLPGSVEELAVEHGDAAHRKVIGPNTVSELLPP